MVRIRYPGRVPRSKPPVPTTKTCPNCEAPDAVGVRTGSPFTRFWYCGRGCGWACWRPPCPAPCPACGRPTVWACSRKSFACVRCGRRVALRAVMTH